jgi:formate C-acetyltransferase
MRVARHSHVITGLPDTYGRGRIVGDYRRVALYGIDFLIAKKQEDLLNCGDGTMTDDVIRLREEIAEQIRALKGMKEMAKAYGYDISQPATRRPRGRAVALLRLPRRHQDPERRRHVRGPHLHLPGHLHPARPCGGHPHREEAQELIDHLTLKFRMVKFARIPSYNELFSGDPVWATLEVAGLGQDGRHMVTKNGLPLPAHPREHGPRARAQPHGPVLQAPARPPSAATRRESPSRPRPSSTRTTT